MMCKKCAKMCGWLILVAGVLFLLRDIGLWEFWNLQWWTIAFLIVGLCHVGKTCCGECQSMCKVEGSSKKKK